MSPSTPAVARRKLSKATPVLSAPPFVFRWESTRGLCRMSVMQNPAESGGASHNSLLGDYFSKTELAEALEVSPRTIDRWETARIGPPRTIIGRQVRYRRAAVEKWLLQRERGAEDGVRARGHHPPPKQRGAAGKSG